MMKKASEGEAGTGKSESEDTAAAAGRLERLRIHEKDDDGLFDRPPPRVDCPICMIVLPLGNGGSTYMNCCGQMICGGCMWEHKCVIEATNARNAGRNRDQGRAPLQYSCAFCREPMPTTDEELVTRLQKRVESEDPAAFFQMAEKYRKGERGVPKDERKAFELYVRSAELGFTQACTSVALCYRLGKGVEKDEEKYRVYLEKAVKAGCVDARHNLGVHERRIGNIDLAARHWLISAASGHQLSLDNIKELYKEGKVSKDDFEDALRSSFAAKKEEWSKERDKWAAEKARLGL